MDINIKSWGQIRAGNYDRIDISGGADITGDISFHIMTIRGAVRAGGLSGDRLNVNGSLDMTGERKGDCIVLNGNISYDHTCRIKKIEGGCTVNAGDSIG